MWYDEGMEETLKYCKKCDQAKALDDFHRDKKAADGRCFYCKECNKRKARENYAANPERAKAYEKKRRLEDPERDRRKNYKRKYGITLEQYNEMLERQGGVCAICAQPERRQETSNLAVDHCHETGEIRGLLCSNCNRAIGLMSDDPERLISAANYLTPGYGPKR